MDQELLELIAIARELQSAEDYVSDIGHRSFGPINRELSYVYRRIDKGLQIVLARVMTIVETRYEASRVYADQMRRGSVE